MYFYQHLPEYINPIAFSIGNFNIHWYSIMYLVGFLVVYALLVHEAKSSKENFKSDTKELIFNFLIYSFIGLVIGARLGYVLFYNLEYFIQNPLAIVSPFDSSGIFVGIFGMSYFGGLVGAVASSIIFCRRNKINFWQWADFVVPAIPAGYFFGRIGNFLNGELYGKATNHWWGMYFRNESFLRHPTQLYEAFLEGALLFAVLWLLRNSSLTTFGDYPKGFINKVRKVVGDKVKFKGNFLAIYLFGYGIIRFFIEFLREPEQGLILGITRGQILSLIVMFTAIMVYLHKIRKACYNNANGGNNG